MAEHAAYLPDLMLVDRCVGGEQAAARELFRQQRGRVQATLYRVLGSNQHMDDLMQETFIRVFRSLANFRGEARLSTWIDRIAVRVAYRHLSRNKRAALTLELSEVAELPDGPRAETYRSAIAREGLRRFYAALAELSPASRLAFALHELDGRSIAEVADALECAHTAAKLRIWRARRALHRRAAEDPILRDFLAPRSADDQGDMQ